MKSSSLASVLFALAALAACGPEAKVYKAAPPAASASAAPPDREAWRNQRPAPGPPGEVRFPAPEVAKLPNGMTLYVVRRPAAVVSMNLVVRQGASALSEGKSGLAALTARMLTEGTRKRSSQALAEAAESLGSSLEADASRDDSLVGISALVADVDKALELLAEVVTTPAFDAKEFERVRAEWLDKLVAERQAPERLAALAGLRLLNGPVHGAPVGGGLTDVKKLGIADLVAFHARAYQPESSALVVVGDISLEAVRASAQKYFAGYRKKPGTKVAAAPPLPPAPQGQRVVIVDRPGAVQTALFVAQRFPARSAPGHEAREVLGEIVGGLFTSRINMNLREKHAYTYGASGRPIATRSWGAFVVSSSVRTDVTAPALAEVVRELERARDPSLGAPIAGDEIGRAKADLLHTLGARLEHTSRVAQAMTALFSVDLGNDYYTRYPNLLAAIGLPELATNAGLLTPDDLVVVLVGDRKEITPGLEKGGLKVEAAAAALTD
jgi:zinc protease